MLAAHSRSFPRARHPAPCVDAIVRDMAEAGTWRLADGRLARQAVSCLVTPEPGDRVLLHGSDDDLFVLHVLDRKDRRSACLSVPGAERLSLRQDTVDVTATKDIAVRAGQGIELTAVRGSLMLSARNLFASAAESLVHTAATYVGKVDQFLVSARHLLRLDGEQAVLDARQDVKIDAERITLG
ncbi:DUF3540 domain-containing protein [Xanthomonas sp. NCPPB 2632]|uniref:DUF3540 domain-containing protein n=1 Tax=Xanthomonas sp. NCPPB 2632 TaxID=3240912 RepID=UPI00351591E3